MFFCWGERRRSQGDSLMFWGGGQDSLMLFGGLRGGTGTGHWIMWVGPRKPRLGHDGEVLRHDLPPHSLLGAILSCPQPHPILGGAIVRCFQHHQIL